MASSESKARKIAIEKLSYEQALAELETIVASLEANQLSLDDTMTLYERGQALAKYCVELLDKAELKVKKLSGDLLVDLPLDE